MAVSAVTPRARRNTEPPMTQAIHVAALDQGTTSTRCLVFDAQGRIVGADQRPHRQITPRPGWVEHDPQEIAAHAVHRGFDHVHARL